MEEITIKNCRENLKLVRETLNLSQAKFSQQLGISQQTYGHYETGKNSIPDKIKIQLLQIGVNLQWLLTGEGEMFLPSAEEKQKAERPSLDSLLATKEEFQELKADLGKLTEAKEKLEEELRKATEAKADRAELVRGLERERSERYSLGQELEELRQYVQHYHPPESYVSEEELPYLGCHAAAGVAIEPENIEGTIWVRVPPHITVAPDMYVARIVGSSMSDIVPDGSLVLLRKVAQPMDGRVYIVAINGEQTLKKLRLDENGLRLVYMDGSGRAFHPDEGDTWECVAQFISVVQKME